jgi:hypothetical protein
MPELIRGGFLVKSKSLTKHLLLSAFLFALAIAPSIAKATGNPQTEPSTVDLSLTSWNSPVLARVALSTPEEPPMLAQNDDLGGQPVDVYGFKRKSPTRAFLQSFLIPGWGQLYAKSAIWKPIMFVGLEAAGWAGYASFHGKGNDAEDVYRAYADEHWDSTRYIDGLYYTFYRRDYPESIKDAWLDTTTYIVLNENNEIMPRSLSHHAWYKEDGSRVESDEYYENVGKYNQFNFGWDDYLESVDGVLPDNPDDSLLTVVSPNRQKYVELRDDANSEFNKANSMLVATVANHLLAGFWAALDARAYNRAQDQFGHIEPKLRLVKSPSNPKKLMPYLTVGYRF